MNKQKRDRQRVSSNIVFQCYGFIFVILIFVPTMISFFEVFALFYKCFPCPKNSSGKCDNAIGRGRGGGYGTFKTSSVSGVRLDLKHFFVCKCIILDIQIQQWDYTNKYHLH